MYIYIYLYIYNLNIAVAGAYRNDKIPKRREKTELLSLRSL